MPVLEMTMLKKYLYIAVIFSLYTTRPVSLFKNKKSLPQIISAINGPDVPGYYCLLFQNLLLHLDVNGMNSLSRS